MAGLIESEATVTLEAPSTPVIPPGRPVRLRAAAQRRQTLARWVVVAVVAVLAALPLLGLLDFSTRFINGKRTGRSWDTIIHWSKLTAAAPGLVGGLKITLLLCAITAVLTVGLLVPTMTWVRLRLPRLRRAMEFICLLPLTIPAIVLVVGLATIYRGIAHVLSTGNIWLTFAYVILALPYAYRAIDVGLTAIDIKTLSEAARSLGASWATVMWRIVLPNIRAAVFGAVFLTVALVLGEFTIAYLLSKNNLAVAVFNLGLNSSGDPRLTAAVALVTLIFGFLLMLVFSFAGSRRRRKRA